MAAWLVLVAASCCVAATEARCEPLVFHASQSGKQTLDQGEGGGNPFASSLIELLGQKSVQLEALPSAMRRLTAAKSGNFQQADVPAAVTDGTWPLAPAKSGERRMALVMVVSDYAATGGAGMAPAQSLPGAKHDAGRVAAALGTAGFKTQLVVDYSRSRMQETLAKFAAESAEVDAAVIYTTGHGVEVGGSVYLLPGDYPLAERNAALPTRALRLAEIGTGLRAKRVNLLFYGGCRDNPLAE